MISNIYAANGECYAGEFCFYSQKFTFTPQKSECITLFQGNQERREKARPPLRERQPGERSSACLQQYRKTANAIILLHHCGTSAWKYYRPRLEEGYACKVGWQITLAWPGFR